VITSWNVTTGKGFTAVSNCTGHPSYSFKEDLKRPQSFQRVLLWFFKLGSSGAKRRGYISHQMEDNLITRVTARSGYDSQRCLLRWDCDTATSTLQLTSSPTSADCLVRKTWSTKPQRSTTNYFMLYIKSPWASKLACLAVRSLPRNFLLARSCASAVRERLHKVYVQPNLHTCEYIVYTSL